MFGISHCMKWIRALSVRKLIFMLTTLIEWVRYLTIYQDLSVKSFARCTMYLPSLVWSFGDMMYLKAKASNGA